MRGATRAAAGPGKGLQGRVSGLTSVSAERLGGPSPPPPKRCSYIVLSLPKGVLRSSLPVKVALLGAEDRNAAHVLISRRAKVNKPGV